MVHSRTVLILFGKFDNQVVIQDFMNSMNLNLNLQTNQFFYQSVSQTLNLNIIPQFFDYYRRFQVISQIHQFESFLTHQGLPLLRLCAISSWVISVEII